MFGRRGAATSAASGYSEGRQISQTIDSLWQINVRIFVALQINANFQQSTDSIPVLQSLDFHPMTNRILILYGTVTGNAEVCANKASVRLNAEGFTTEIKDIIEVDARQLQEESILLLCVSTHGDGSPPNSAMPLWKKLVRDSELNLSGLRFAVLGLGDSSYSKFCQCGKDFDASLEHQGGERIAPRVDADVEYEGPCAAWIESVVAALNFFCVEGAVVLTANA